MSSDEIVAQLQQIVDTLRRIVEASGELAARVETLEQESGEKLGLLTGLQGHLKVLLETYVSHVEAQNATNTTVADSIGALEARITALEKHTRE